VCSGDALRPAAAIYPFKGLSGPSTLCYFNGNSSYPNAYVIGDMPFLLFNVAMSFL